MRINTNQALRTLSCSMARTRKERPGVALCLLPFGQIGNGLTPTATFSASPAATTWVALQLRADPASGINLGTSDCHPHTWKNLVHVSVSAAWPYFPLHNYHTGFHKGLWRRKCLSPAKMALSAFGHFRRQRATFAADKFNCVPRLPQGACALAT